MSDKVSLKDVGKKNKPEMIVTSFNFERVEYLKFKENLKSMDVKLTDALFEFMKRVNKVFVDGGEVVFEVEGKSSGKKKKILFDVEEVLEREVVGIGNGAHINIPLKHLGKKARVIIKRKENVDGL